MNLLAAAAVVSSLLVFATPAHAGSPEPPPPECCSKPRTIKLDPSTAKPGTKNVKVTGAGFRSCDTVEITSPELSPGGSLGKPKPDPDGNFKTEFDVPANAYPDEYTVSAQCRNHGNPYGDPATAKLTVEAAPRPKPTISLDRYQVSPSQTVRVTGDHFQPCPVPVSVLLNKGGPNQRPLTQGTLGSTGSFTASFTVPGVPAGSYVVNALCVDQAGNRLTDDYATATPDLSVAVTGGGSGGGGGSSSGGSGGGGSSGAGSNSGGGGGSGSTGNGGQPPVTYPPYTPDPPPYTPPVPPQPQVTPTSGDSGPGTAVLGALAALLLAALVPLLRRVIKPPPPPTPVVDAVLVGSGGPPTTLRETGADSTVALRVVGRVEPGTQTVRWREEGE